MDNFRHPYREVGAGKGARTLDLNLGKVALYQLSYSRIARLNSNPVGPNEGRYSRDWRSSVKEESETNAHFFMS
jgi:hypothetical protein